MVQREIADRLAAQPGNKEYGIPSVLVQHACEVEFVRPISRNVFRPPPNVDSGARTPAPHRSGGAATRSPTWCARAFAHRRKALPRSLEEARRPGGRARRRDRVARGHGPPARRARRDAQPRRLRPARARPGALRLRFVTRAPAKLNLCLYVGPLRPDGLHELRSVFQPITLADEVVLEQAPVGPRRGGLPGRRRAEPGGCRAACFPRALRLGRSRRCASPSRSTSPSRRASAAGPPTRPRCCGWPRPPPGSRPIPGSWRTSRCRWAQTCPHSLRRGPRS